MKRPIACWIGSLGALAAACTVRPLTPTPEAAVTLPAAVAVVSTFTPTATQPATETLVPTETQVPTVPPSPTQPVISFSASLEGPAAALPAAQVPPMMPPAAELPVATPEVALPPTPPPASEAGEVAAAEQYAVDSINYQRAAAGLAPLLRDEVLMDIARARVADMIARDYTGHNDPSSGAPLARQMMRAAGYTSVYLGENWYGSSKPPAALVDIAMTWFMIDAPHAANILSPNFVAVGVGIGHNGRQWLLVQNFVGPN